MNPLQLSATAEEISAAIHQVQARCKVGLIENPDEVAGQVRAMLDRCELAAAALGIGLSSLGPRGWFGPRQRPQDGAFTAVRVDQSRIVVDRSQSVTNTFGTVELTVRPAGEKPWWDR